MRDFVRMPPQAGRKPPAAQHRPALKTAKPTTGFAAQRTGQLVRHPEISPAPPSRDIWRAATAGAAAPLPHRGTMERLFGRAFSGVRAYFGRSAPLNALGAKAATDGERVAFASHAPSRRQVAHELAHVVQMRQGGGTADGSRLSRPGSPAEREADRVAERAGRGEPVSVAEAAPAALHRDLKSGKLEVPHGFFKIDMTKKEGVDGRSGEDGQIHFRPKDTAPDTVRIRLSQAVKRTDLSTGQYFDWAAADPAEADRNLMRTASRRRVHKTAAGETLDSISLQHFGSADQARQIGKDNAKLIAPAAPEALTDTAKPLPSGLSLQILGAVSGGFVIDHFPSNPAATKRTNPSQKDVLQDYVWPTEHKANNHDGHKKGDDIREAVLDDFPGTGKFHVRWNFETVARSDDIGLYYGTLWWQFEADATVSPPKVTKENYGIKPGISDTFRGALVEFNRFYANPHTVVAGQTLEQISELYYGKAGKADAIFEHNKALIGNRDSPLQPGWKLRLPRISA